MLLQRDLLGALKDILNSIKVSKITTSTLPKITGSSEKLQATHFREKKQLEGLTFKILASFYYYILNFTSLSSFYKCQTFFTRFMKNHQHYFYFSALLVNNIVTRVISYPEGDGSNFFSVNDHAPIGGPNRSIERMMF